MGEKLVLSIDPEKNLGILIDFLGKTRNVPEWEILVTYNRYWEKCYETRAAEGRSYEDTALYTGLDAIINTANEFGALDEFKEHFKPKQTFAPYKGINN